MGLQNGVHPGYRSPRIGRVVADFKTQRACLPVFLNIEKVRRVGRRRFRVGHQIVGEGHVVRRKRRAVLPLQIVPQLEAHEAAVFGNFPLLRRELHNFQIPVVFERSRVQQRGHFLRGRIRGKIGDQVGRLPDAAHENTPAEVGFPLRRIRPRRSGRISPVLRGRKRAPGLGRSVRDSRPFLCPRRAGLRLRSKFRRSGPFLRSRGVRPLCCRQFRRGRPRHGVGAFLNRKRRGGRIGKFRGMKSGASRRDGQTEGGRKRDAQAGKQESQHSEDTK